MKLESYVVNPCNHSRPGSIPGDLVGDGRCGRNIFSSDTEKVDSEGRALFQVDAGTLSSQASRFRAVVDDLESDGEKAASALTAAMSAAGDSTVSGALADATASLEASLETIAAQVSGIAPALTTTATNYSNADSCSAQGLMP